MKNKYLSVIFFSLLCIPAAAQQLTVSCATLDWPPYISNTDKNRGYVFEIVTEAFKRSGYTAEISFYPWARASALMENGYVDALLPEYYSKERELTAIFSEPFPGGPAGLMKKKSLKVKWPADPQKDQTAALKALSGYRFGAVRDYINTEEFDKASFIIKDLADSDETNLIKLYNSRVDFIFIDKLVGEYIIRTKHPDYSSALEFMEPAMEEKELYLAFSRKVKGVDKKLAAFNSGLAGMKKDGSLNSILKAHGF
jgi:ABC-type amino acid transport substrate-binding protein